MSTDTTAAAGIGSVNVLSAFMPFLLAAIFIFIVLYLVYWMLKNNKGLKSKGNFFKILASQSIDQHTNIHLIKYLESYFVLITTQGNVEVLERIDDEEIKEELNLKFISSRNSAFSNILNRKIFEDQIKKMDNF
ncbi:MAG TPA: flagellar biosynthetic protein FliO [Thermotogota bacterium]|nr:flagellar biosynthetic protein FliO [Thermotogota bacterium]HPJ90211.1 flagellar biosynthetic protein FliO [Thermotogota bacterium]HPR97410.1 flagellar biosynthetic protein FliO [Thermotogota bacterium]